MKRVVLLFVIAIVLLGLNSQAAEAQRSGSMQATARVVDTREALTGLQSARNVASHLTSGQQFPATVETSLSVVSIDFAARPEGDLDRPRMARVTINYLRN